MQYCEEDGENGPMWGCFYRSDLDLSSLELI
jgi:hypothetical protein